MSKHEALTRMGIQNPGEIARYELYSVDQMDILRIIYDRKKGSILPVVRKYRFPQIKKSTMVDSGTRKTQVLYESSAELRNAVADLDQLMKSRKDTAASKETLVHEVQLLEEEFALRVNYIKSLIDKM
jgi:hypothetical protein